MTRLFAYVIYLLNNTRVGLIAFWLFFIVLPTLAFIAAGLFHSYYWVLLLTPVVFLLLTNLGERIIRGWNAWLNELDNKFCLDNSATYKMYFTEGHIEIGCTPKVFVEMKVKTMFPSALEQERAFKEIARLTDSKQLQLAALYLCDVDLDKLKYWVDLGKGDYRDLLIAAEFPISFHARSQSKSTLEDIRNAEKAEWQNYRKWLLKQPKLVLETS